MLRKITVYRGVNKSQITNTNPRCGRAKPCGGGLKLLFQSENVTWPTPFGFFSRNALTGSGAVTGRVAWPLFTDARETAFAVNFKSRRFSPTPISPAGLCPPAPSMDDGCFMDWYTMIKLALW